MAADLGRLFYAWVAVVNAAKEGAAYGALNPLCVDDSRPACSGTKNVEWHVENETELAVTATRIQCLSPGGTVRSPISQCGRVEGENDTYVVEASYQFDLLTPIVGQVLGDSLLLTQEARARVIEAAFDPTPGVEIKKHACAGTSCTPAETPILDEDLNLVYTEVQSGDPITYQLVVTNIGGQNLTGVTVTDSAGSLPTGTTNCAAVPATMTPAQVWTCTYVRTAPNPGGPPEMLHENTATVDTNQLDPIQGRATVKVIAAPASLALTKRAHVYRLGGNGSGPTFDGSATWTAHRNAAVGSVVMWFQIRVTNTGGQDAASFSLSDSSGALPTNADCPARPTTLGPGATYTCYFSRTFDANDTNAHTATATATGLSDASTTTVTVQACPGSDLVVPKLVGLTKTNAQATWTAAGFTGTMTSWSGQPNTVVVTQNRTAYDCAAASSTITVTR